MDTKKAIEIITGDEAYPSTIIEATLYLLSLKEPKTGKWIYHPAFDGAHKNPKACFECSSCHVWISTESFSKTKYCPDCGAEMKEV